MAALCRRDTPLDAVRLAQTHCGRWNERHIAALRVAIERVGQAAGAGLVERAGLAEEAELTGDLLAMAGCDRNHHTSADIEDMLYARFKATLGGAGSADCETLKRCFDNLRFVTCPDLMAHL